jgi:tetratricopeptide (TPR) repeat protein
VVLAYALVQGRRMKAAALFAAGLAIVLAPVAARNAYVGGGFYITTSQAGPNFYIGNNPDADGTYQSLRFGRGAPEFERQDATELAERALGRALTPAEVSSYWFDKAAQFITSQPGRWLKLTARKFALLWNAGEAVDTESQEAHADYSLVLRLLAVVGHFGVLVPLALAGVIATWSMRGRIWILYALAAAYGASVVLFYVFARYRYPLVPLLVMFAAAAIVRAAEWTQSARSTGVSAVHAIDRKQAGMAAAASIAAAIFCNWPMLPVQTMRAVTETNLGAALQAEGHVDEAVAHYERAVALQPDYAPAYNNLGTALRTAGRLGDAVHAYERALQARRDYPEAHYNLANTLTDAGKPREAAEHFRVALRSMDASADVHNNLGIALAAEGKADEAVAEFRAAVAADPTSPKSHRNLADALAAAGDGEEAIAEFRRAAQLAPADEGIRYDLGSLLLEHNQIDAAIAELRAALKLNPKSPRTHNNLGIAFGSEGRMDEAIAEFRAALAIDPEFADAKRNLAMALGARKKG